MRTCSNVEFRNAVITHLQNYHQTVLLRSIFHCWAKHAVRRHLIRRMLTKWKHAAKGMNHEEFVTEVHVTCAIIKCLFIGFQ